MANLAPSRPAPTHGSPVEPPPRARGELAAADRALLELLVLRGRTYADIAQLLKLDVNTVAARALAVAERLTGSTLPPPGLDAREQIADFVLGQQTPAQGRRTRELIARSLTASEWHSELRASLVREGLTSRAMGPGPPAPAQPPDLEARVEASEREAQEHARRALRLERAGVALGERIERLEAARIEQAARTRARIQELEAAQRRAEAEVDAGLAEQRRLRTALAAAREEAASLRVALRERAAQVEQLRAQVRERDAELEALRDQLLTVVPEPAALEPTALEPAAVPSPSSPRPPTVARPRPSRRRRTGSLLYVAGATGAVAVGAVLIANGDDSAVSKAAATPRVPTATPRSPSGPVTRARVATEFTMTPVGRSTVAGSGALLKAGRHLTLVIELKAPRRDRASLFAVWLTGSARPKLLGFVPPAQTAGTFSGDTPLPVNARRYRTVTVTFERSHAPARPGTRILRAALPPLRSSSGR